MVRHLTHWRLRRGCHYPWWVGGLTGVSGIGTIILGVSVIAVIASLNLNTVLALEK